MTEIKMITTKIMTIKMMIKVTKIVIQITINRTIMMNKIIDKAVA